ATARSSPTAGACTPSSTRARTGRRACRPGWSTRSLLPSARRARRARRSARAARALLLPLRPLLRPGEHDARLAAVRRVPRVVVQELPGGQVDEPANARRPRGLAAVLDDGLALEQRRIGNPLDGRPARLGERSRVADDAAVDRRAVEVDDERGRGDER